MRIKNILLFRIILTSFILSSFLTGCSKKDNHTIEASDNKKRQNALSVLAPQASGDVLYGNDLVSIDASNMQNGYVMIKYSGAAEKAKVQITIPGGTVYTYTLGNTSYETFPLTGGNGSYQIDILENVQDDMYALIFSQKVDAAITNEFDPFLYPNQYVWFSEDTKAVSLGQELSGKSSDDLNYVQNVYYYIIENIVYDEAKAANIPTDYLPDIDETLQSKKGICFDYASLMAAMLRSQSIPTRLEVGYSGEAYHAWISVYLKEKGWVDSIIEFNGNSWSLMDPTLAASNSSKSVGKYVGDGSNYIVKYSY